MRSASARAQVRDGMHDVREARALALEQGGDVHQHPVRLSFEVVEVGRPAMLVDACGPGDEERDPVRLVYPQASHEVRAIFAGFVDVGEVITVLCRERPP